MTDNEIIEGLRHCGKIENCLQCGECPYFREVDCVEKNTNDVLDLINRKQSDIDRLEIELQAMRGAANSYKMQNERLLKIAKAMHTWIFLHTGNEEKAYEECGLTDEENALLGYCGKLEFEVGDDQDD